MVRNSPDPLLDPERLRRFLREHHLPPLDRFGQHFLADEGALHDIVAASDTDPTIPVIEVGAGLGVLTRALARERERRDAGVGEQAIRKKKRGGPTAPLIAVELDQRLIPLLRERVREFPAVSVIHADILSVDPAALLSTLNSQLSTRYDVIGNIPYNITAPILQKFLSRPPHQGLRPGAGQARRMTLLVDDSLARAMAAVPPDMSLRAVGVQVYAEPTIVRSRIPPSVFLPPPAVHSAILSLVSRPSPLIPLADERAFFHLVRAGFAQKRKMLANALGATYRLTAAEAREWLTKTRLDPRRRAETLSISDWQRLLTHAPPKVRRLTGT